MYMYRNLFCGLLLKREALSLSVFDIKAVFIGCQGPPNKCDVLEHTANGPELNVLFCAKRLTFYKKCMHYIF